MTRSLFEHKTYKSYLIHRLGPTGSRTGEKSKFALATKIQTAFLTQVLFKNAELSLEQAERANRFFHHTEEESHFFMLLVQKDKAATQELKKYFDHQIQFMLEKRSQIKTQVGEANQISKEHELYYYSSWIPAAVHIATTIPEFQNTEKIADKLGIPTQVAHDTLKKLHEAGLIQWENQRAQPTKQQIHLEQSSLLIKSHHTQWRQRAMQSISEGDPKDVHYSVVVSLSKSDVERIQNKILSEIKSTIDVVKESKEEALYGWSVDFFNLEKEK